MMVGVKHCSPNLLRYLSIHKTSMAHKLQHLELPGIVSLYSQIQALLFVCRVGIDPRQNFPTTYQSFPTNLTESETCGHVTRINFFCDLTWNMRLSTNRHRNQERHSTHIREATPLICTLSKSSGQRDLFNLPLALLPADLSPCSSLNTLTAPILGPQGYVLSGQCQ